MILESRDQAISPAPLSLLSSSFLVISFISFPTMASKRQRESRHPAIIPEAVFQLVSTRLPFCTSTEAKMRLQLVLQSHARSLHSTHPAANGEPAHYRVLPAVFRSTSRADAIFSTRDSVCRVHREYGPSCCRFDITTLKACKPSDIMYPMVRVVKNKHSSISVILPTTP